MKTKHLRSATKQRAYNQRLCPGRQLLWGLTPATSTLWGSKAFPTRSPQPPHRWRHRWHAVLCGLSLFRGSSAHHPRTALVTPPPPISHSPGLRLHPQQAGSTGLKQVLTPALDRERPPPRPRGGSVLLPTVPLGHPPWESQNPGSSSADLLTDLRVPPSQVPHNSLRGGSRGSCVKYRRFLAPLVTIHSQVRARGGPFSFSCLSRRYHLKPTTLGGGGGAEIYTWITTGSLFSGRGEEGPAAPGGPWGWALCLGHACKAPRCYLGRQSPSPKGSNFSQAGKRRTKPAGPREPGLSGPSGTGRPGPPPLQLCAPAPLQGGSLPPRSRPLRRLRTGSRRSQERPAGEEVPATR